MELCSNCKCIFRYLIFIKKALIKLWIRCFNITDKIQVYSFACVGYFYIWTFIDFFFFWDIIDENSNNNNNNDKITVDADEIRRLGKRFRKLDLDNSGALSIDEFMSLPELQQNPLVQRVIDIFDADGNGEVDFKEFIQGVSQFSVKVANSVCIISVL